jgi:hypothetical protein
VDINQECKLYISNVFLHDISACHYTILERFGFDLSKLDREDKKQRNIQIGLWIRDNKELGKFLRNITISTIDEYILLNEISEENIIVRQYDGLITSQFLRETENYIPLPQRVRYDFILLSFDRKKYIAYSAGKDELAIKGVPYRYPEMDKIYKILAKQLTNPKPDTLFQRMREIHDRIMESKSPLLFCIPTTEDKFNVFLKGYGEVEISKTTTKLLDTNDIERIRYFDHYMWPFIESVIVEFTEEHYEGFKTEVLYRNRGG